MRSSDIVANCRETALRVEINGEWGELADTLRGAADEVERLRGEQQLRAERMLTTGLVGETGRVVQLQRDWRQVVAERNADIARLAAEVERLRLEPSVQEEIVAWSVDLHDAREEIKRLTAEVERLRLRPEERFLLGVISFDGHLVKDLLERQGGGK